MKKLIYILPLLFLAQISIGQVIPQKIIVLNAGGGGGGGGNTKYVKQGYATKVDSTGGNTYIVSVDTTLLKDSTFAKAPLKAIGDTLTLNTDSMPRLNYFGVTTGMLSANSLIPKSYVDSNLALTTTSANKKTDTVQNIASLQSYTGNSNSLIVADTLRGGVFYNSTSGTPDSMTVFNRAGGGYWVRIFNKSTYNILWSGVDPTGTLDNTSIINYILANIADSSTLVFPNGTYNVTALRIPYLVRGVTITGNKVGSILKCTSAGSVLLTIAGGYVTIRDMQLFGNGLSNYGTSATNGNLINIDSASGLILDRVFISGSAGSGIYSDSLGNINNIEINNCIISSVAKAGIHLVGRGSSNQVNVVHVNNTTVVSTGGNGMEFMGQSISVKNNTFETSLKRALVVSNDLLNGTNVSSAAGINIKDNYFEECDSGFILIKGLTGIVDIAGVSIEGNYGNYSVTGVNPITTTNINICEVQDPLFSSYSSTSILGFRFINNLFGSTPTVNSIFNGNNVLGISAVIQTYSNGSLAAYKNLGAAMILQGNYYINGNGTTNYIPKWNGTNSQVNSLIYDNGTNVGIGTALPTKLLTVGSANNLTVDNNGNVIVGRNNVSSSTPAQLTFGEYQPSGGRPSVIINGALTYLGWGVADASGNHIRMGAGSTVWPTFGTVSFNLAIDGGLSVGTATIAPTNGLLVGGTSTLSTVNDAAGNFMTVPSGGGLVTRRTAAETLTDIGAQPKGASGQTTLVAGTKSITVSGVTTSSTATLGFVSLGGTVSTTWQYAVVCSTNTVTITALTNTGTTDASDTSTLNYSVTY